MKIKIVSWLLVFAALFTACNDDDPFHRQEKRTVLIYMAGDNSLSSYIKNNINKIREGISLNGSDGNNLLVYADQPSGASLIRIYRGSDNQAISETLESYRTQNSADPEVLNGVINRVINKYPADNYGLILWSHGSAWLPGDLSGKLRSFGQDNQNIMEIDELAEALPDKVFDFILFDACYMASTEVIYELRNKANYIIASPTEVLAEGFPYEKLIAPLFAQPKADVVEMGRAFYEYYKNSYGTVSVSATAPMEELTGILRNVLNGREDDIYTLPIDNIQKMEYLQGYKYHALYDLDDFINRMATTDQYAKFKKCLEKIILYKATTPQSIYSYNYTGRTLPMDHFSGLSIYLPQSTLPELNAWYLGNIEWAKAVYE